jgi:hypothetical protein
VLRGETLRSIVLDWNARGITTTTGTAWTIGKLRALLRQPRLAGLQTHQGEIIGDGNWPAIIDRQTHERIVAIFATRRRDGRKKPARVYTLGAGILKCGLCGASLRGVRDSHDRTRYVCPSVGTGGCGRVVVDVDRAEATVLDLLVAHIDGPDFARALRRAQRAADDSETKVAKLYDELTAARARLTELGDAFADGEMSRSEWQRLTARAKERTAALETELGRVESSGPAASLKGRGHPLRDAWPRMTLDERRTVIGALATHFTVAPAAPPKNVFRPERIVPAWRF